MSSLRNTINRRAHKERSQPQSRRTFGLLEKHKDYVVRAKAFHKKEVTLRKLNEKAAFRNSDEFYFKMINTKTVDGVHLPESQGKRYIQEELMLMRTQDMGYILQKMQSEKKKIERLAAATLQSLGDHGSSSHVYYAESRYEARETQSNSSRNSSALDSKPIPKRIQRKMSESYRELETRKSRVKDLEKIYMGMALQKELQKKGRKRKLREDEVGAPTLRPVYKWRAERKR